MTTSAPGTTLQVLEELITTFNDLNSSTADELYGEPTSLEFMRYVGRNSPFVARGAATDWPAVRLWSADYLARKLAGHSVAVAVTPDGRADAPTGLPDGTVVFAKPLEESKDIEAFLRFVVAQEHDAASSEVWYAQSQNNNLQGEYAVLADDVRPGLAFAQAALGRDPDAANVWMGTSRSETALHRDSYENIYVQLVGRKHFVLLSPVCQPCVAERPLLPATYVRCQTAGSLRLVPDAGDAALVPFPLWDPDAVAGGSMHLSSLARPVRVTLEPGDMLYLPAMWYHKVTQSCADGAEPFVAAVNYWYDMEYGGPLYSLCSMIRNLGLQLPASKSFPDPES